MNGKQSGDIRRTRTLSLQGATMQRLRFLVAMVIAIHGDERDFAFAQKSGRRPGKL
jgi:hypothetical protein